MEKKKNRLLFVCLGNICRSPAAEGVMKSLTDKAGVAEEFLIDSAGIGNWHVGQLPDKRMRLCGARRGYDFSSRARQIDRKDFGRFDRILVMDNENMRTVKALAPTQDDAEKVEMLASYITRHPEATVIPDPYYGDDSDFDYALDLIEDGCRGLLYKLTKHRFDRKNI